MRRHFPLRTHLLALVLGTLLPALALAGFVLTRAARDNRAALDRTLQDAARTLVTVIDGEILSTMRSLQTLASSEALRRGDLAAFYDTATSVQQAQPAWRVVVLSAADRQLVNTAIPFETRLGPPVEPESIARVFTSGQPTVGALRRNSRGEYGVAVRVPVRQGQQITHVLSAVIRPESLVALMHQSPAPDEWARGLVDATGTVVARVPDPEQFIGQRATDALQQLLSAQGDGTYHDVSLDGASVYVGYARGPVSHWLAAVAVRQEVVGRMARESLMALVQFGGVLLVVGGLATFVISRRISRDIEHAAEAADLLASGQRTTPSTSTVSELQRVMAALAHSAEMLHVREQERDEHIARAEEARRVAEAADLAKDEFLATLGHELRNPLAPALTALHLMRLRGDPGSAREREIIERQVRHLARLVDDLLDVSRARSGRLELRRHPFEIVHALEVAIEIAGPLITSRRHTLTVDVPASGLVVNGDETRLAQVFANILNNAAKYSDGPGRISISGGVDGSEVVIRVADDGLGIERSLLPRVFDQFLQGRQSLGREQGGLGLGLSVAKTIVDLHGGRIQADSEGPGFGSTFTVILPRAIAPAAVAEPSLPAALPASGGRRVLVVDDNQDAAETLSEMLRMAGFSVATTYDGVSALHANQTFRADVALLDIGLPAMDGLELAKRLRASEAGRQIRLIAMTGYGQAADVEASRASGFDRHLVKPVVAELLLQTIAELSRTPVGSESGEGA